MLEGYFNNDLLLKGNPADMIIQVTVLDDEHKEKTVTMLFDSSDEWLKIFDPEGDFIEAYKGKEQVAALGFWGAAFLKTLLDTDAVKVVYIERYQIVNGQASGEDLPKPSLFIKDGRRYKRARVTKATGSVEFWPEDEI
jgi:hypothetical protein